MPLPPSTTTRRCRFGQQPPPSALPHQDADAALNHQPPRRFGQQPPPSAIPDEDVDAARSAATNHHQASGKQGSGGVVHRKVKSWIESSDFRSREGGHAGDLDGRG